MWVHGGPAMQTRANFRPDIQMLLSQGFAVLMPNARGSTGYGRAFMLADEVEKRPDFMEDLATGRAWLASQPNIDRDTAPAHHENIIEGEVVGWVDYDVDRAWAAALTLILIVVVLYIAARLLTRRNKLARR